MKIIMKKSMIHIRISFFILSIQYIFLYCNKELISLSVCIYKYSEMLNVTKDCCMNTLRINVVLKYWFSVFILSPICMVINP